MLLVIVSDSIGPHTYIHVHTCTYMYIHVHIERKSVTQTVFLVFKDKILLDIFFEWPQKCPCFDSI